MSKPKKCKHCKEEMNPIYNSLQKYCVNKSECVSVWVELEKEKQWKKKKSKIRQDLMTLQDYLKIHCNQYRGGNIHDYKKNLVIRIGEDRLNELDKLAHQTRKYTIDEVKELIKKYKELTK
jgi:hypothetical protein